MKATAVLNDASNNAMDHIGKVMPANKVPLTPATVRKTAPAPAITYVEATEASSAPRMRCINGMYNAYTTAAPSARNTPCSGIGALHGEPTISVMPTSASASAAARAPVSRSLPVIAANSVTHAGYV